MHNNKFLRDLLTVFWGNGISLICSIIVTLLIPNFISINQFGYFKMFTLYISYSGLFHLGFIDGILLRYAGFNYNKLDKMMFRGNSRFFIWFQLLLIGICVLFEVLFIQEKFRMVIAFFLVDTIFLNITNYFQFISQATQRFQLLTIRNVIQSLLRIFMILFLFYMSHVAGPINVNLLIILWILVDFTLMCWYVLSYRELILGPAISLKDNFGNIINYFRVGLPLTISYQLFVIISNLDNQFVAALYGTKVYGSYAFAYSMMSLINVVMTSISIVLLPNLKKKTPNQLMKNFYCYMSVITIISFSGIAAFYLFSLIIEKILPAYSRSLVYLKVIFSGMAFSSCINVIMFTYYQVLNKINLYFKIGSLVLLFSFIVNLIVVKIFNTPISIAIMSIVVLFCWYMISEYYFIITYHVKWKKNLLYNILLLLIFYSTGFLDNTLFECLVYVCMFLSLTFCFYHKDILSWEKNIN